MNEFRQRLGGQVNEFVVQARTVDQMDRQLLVQRDRALRLHVATTNLKQGAAALTSELELILHHQDEIHEALSALERQVEAEGRNFPDRPSERRQAYELVESLDRELHDTRGLLNDTLERVNTGGSGGGGRGGPSAQLAQMVHVLDVHLSAFQYLDHNSKKVEAALAQADHLLSQLRR